MNSGKMKSYFGWRKNTVTLPWGEGIFGESEHDGGESKKRKIKGLSHLMKGKGDSFVLLRGGAGEAAP